MGAAAAIDSADRALAGAGRRRRRERRRGDVGAVGARAQGGRPARRLRRDVGRATVEVNLPRLFFKQYEIIGSSMGSYQEFAELTALVDQGLDVQIDQVFPLADYQAALARLEAGEQLGKIVLAHCTDGSSVR